MPSPQTKIDRVVEEINEAILSGRKVDEFTIQRWSRDADSMRASGNLFAYYELNGMLSQLEGDVVATKDWFQKAVYQQPDNTMAVSNYVTALSLCRDYLGALENAKRLYRLANSIGDTEYVNKGLVFSVIFCCRLGRFIEAQDLIKRIPENYDTSLYRINESVFSGTVDFMKQHDISDDDVARIILLAYGIYVSDYTQESSRSGVASIVDNVEHLLQLQIPVDGDAVFASKLNDQLFDKIIESDVDPRLLSILSCVFVPYKG